MPWSSLTSSLCSLYVGKEQSKLLGYDRINAVRPLSPPSLPTVPPSDKSVSSQLLKEQSIRQGLAYDSTVDPLPHIESFVKTYHLNLSELLKPNLKDYKSFNEFFFRKLKEGARPIAEKDDENVVSSAADCRLTVFESVQKAQQVWIKVSLFPRLSERL